MNAKTATKSDIAPKSIEDSFIDWEASAFGFGYGSGEEHTLAALKTFMSAIGTESSPNAYDYQKLESALGPQVAWLLINILCRHNVDIIEYGTSPRYGWLTAEGVALKAFVDSKRLEELVDLCTAYDDDHSFCYPSACNHGPDGYVEGRKCQNPFWRTR